MPFYPCLGEGSPTKIDYRKTVYPYSNLSTGGPREECLSCMLPVIQLTLPMALEPVVLATVKPLSKKICYVEVPSDSFSYLTLWASESPHGVDVRGWLQFFEV